MSFVIAPLRLIKGENNFAPYEDTLRSIQDAAFKRASEIWTGYTPGGLYPGDQQFGICPLRQNEMANDVGATTLSGSYQFRKNVTATGWRPMFSYTVRKDVIHAFAGFAISDEISRIIQLRCEFGDRIYPIMDLHEAKTWGGFAVIFKEDVGKELISEPESRVLVRAYFDTTGYQTLIPLGFQLFKRKDLVITEP